MVDFYTKVFSVKAEGDNVHAEMNIGGVNLAIYSTAGMESLAPGCMQNAGCGSFTINFEVVNVDTEYKRIKTLGVPIVKPLATHPWGARAFWFRDPDGNIIDIYSRV